MKRRLITALGLAFLGGMAVQCTPDPGSDDDDDSQPSGTADASQQVQGTDGGVEADASQPDAATSPTDAGPRDAAIIFGGDAGSQLSESVRLVDLGMLNFDAQGNSEEGAVAVPEGAISLSIIADGFPGIRYAVNEWTSPDGTVLAAGMQIGSHLNRTMFMEGSPVLHVPITPDVQDYFIPGTYKFTLKASKGTLFPQPDTRSVPIMAVIKMGPRPETGTVDVNIFCTTAAGISAADAPTHPRITAMLAGWNSLYNQVGISIGTVRYYDMDPQFKVLESVQGENAELGKACQLTEGAPVGINVVMVEQISAGGILGGIGTILGVSGGIPGTGPHNGFERSCLAINLTKPDEIPEDILALLVAHEAGHYLGLYHTTENDLAGMAGFKYDPISDTAQDDPNYVMYNNPAEGTNPVLSPMQGQVMRQNALVR